MYFAHTKSDAATGKTLSTDKWQTIKAHLQNVAELARKFGNDFESGEIAMLCGLLHDIGKYSEKFQKHLIEGGNAVDHSTAGAVEIYKKYGDFGLLLAYCIAGHHTGLPDGGSPLDTPDEPTLYGRLHKADKIESYEKYKDEINPGDQADFSIPIHPLCKIGFSLSFYIRMLYSCLVDADFIDTENAMNNGVDRQIGESFPVLTGKLGQYIKSFDDLEKPINRWRTKILHSCLKRAEGEKGLYTLTVPTGGGKTVSSLAFALTHARLHGMKRVIYVIPYNSIIEQNAAVFKKILGDENVLEHHSNFNYDDSSEKLIRQRLATENWDVPVVVTTTVQFFESLFANRSSKCRKLHNIADSVIIFDEAQMLPLPYLKPCVRAIAELVLNYSCTAVLCSATQPALSDLFPKELTSKEISDDRFAMFEFFRRTEIRMLGELSDQELAMRLNGEKQVLCIVNTRKQAQALYELLNKEGVYHLSTLMYPRHRSDTLKEIRARLKDGLPCRVVSTSLIEAGVDVDFPVVYRAQAGLDSEIQAAGRCNREGNSTTVSPVYIFEPEQKYQRHLPAIQARPAEVARSVAAQFADCASPEAITAYFMQLYAIEDRRLDSKDVVKCFEEGYEKGMSFPFATVAEKFSLIDNATRSILIPYTDEAKKLADNLRAGLRSRQLMRKVQQYCVNVYENHYQALYGAGCILPLDNEIALLTDLKKYKKDTGLEAAFDTGVGVFV